MSKKKPGSHGIVYSTDPSFRLEEDLPADVTAPIAQQRLRIKLDTKQRAGKSVTLVEGFSGKKEDLEELGKKLKTYCGTGGSVKDGQIIIQGDQRDKIQQWLLKSGYSSSKRL
jgi:translation initiation factor 1